MKLLLLYLMFARQASAYAPVCQIQGRVTDRKEPVTVAAYGTRDGAERFIAKASPDKRGQYKIYFGGTYRGSFKKIVVRLIDSHDKVLQESAVPETGRTMDCRNTVDF